MTGHKASMSVMYGLQETKQWSDILVKSYFGALYCAQDRAISKWNMSHLVRIPHRPDYFVSCIEDRHDGW